MDKDLPFLFGAQYYRAPTPSKEHWDSDLKKMKDAGFNSVKFWVQWRWSHKAPDKFYFEDLDCLMDIAEKYGLRVTLNVIFDVAPLWLYENFPDAKQITAKGEVIEPCAVGHRQIGGFPGPCYNHPGAKKARTHFLRETVKHFKDHPALDMWDVWNEPEQCGIYREPRFETLTCFCDNCRKKFVNKMLKKYGSVEKLNEVWGKCFNCQKEIELPLNGFTFGDFIDYREFQLDTMKEEADMRLNCVKQFDNKHPVYLHVVPNTSTIFNSLTGADDFALAENCDIFTSTNFATPIWSVLTLSAAAGKTAYNVECHIGNGSTRLHQKNISYKDLVKDLVTQIGLGIRGFMFWQFRPESLGLESPAWGAIKPDGTDGNIFKASKEFIKRLLPFEGEIMSSKVKMPEIAVWKGRKNEILSFCINNSLSGFATSVENYVNAAYYNNYNCIVADDGTIINGGLDGVKLLVMPYCYGLSKDLAKSVSDFVKRGGTVLCEAHLGGYDVDKGRHSEIMPGQDLWKEWGIREEETTAAYYLEQDTSETLLTDNSAPDLEGLSDDVKKAVKAYGTNGGKYFPIILSDGNVLAGAERFAALSVNDGEVLGRFNGVPCIVSKQYGNGKIIYCGTNLAEGAEADKDSFEKFVVKVFNECGIKPDFGGNIVPQGVHIDVISEKLIVVNNASDKDIKIHFSKECKGIFFDVVPDIDGNVTLPPNTVEMFFM